MDDKTLQAEIKSYFDMAGFADTPEKKNPTAEKFRRLLPISIGFLQSLGVGLDDIPTENQLEQLDAYLNTLKNKSGHNYSGSTIHDWKRHTKNFFTYRHKSKGDTHMITDNSIMGLDPELEITTSENNTPNTAHEQNSSITAQPDTDTVRAGIVPDTVTEPAKKPGRPTKGKEERDKKITVNVPSALFDDIKDLANIDNVTIPDIINDIFEKAAQERANDIQTIRDLRARRATQH